MSLRTLLSLLLLSAALACSAQSSEASGAKPKPSAALEGATKKSVAMIVGQYELIRKSLIQDKTDGIKAASARIKELAQDAATHKPGQHKERFVAIQQGASALEAVPEADLAKARSAFGQLSRPLVEMLSAQKDLLPEHHVFKCPMVEGYGEWVQLSAKLENPYMGQKMLACGEEVSK